MRISNPRTTPAALFRAMCEKYGLPKYLDSTLFSAIQGGWVELPDASQTKFHHGMVSAAGVQDNITVTDNDEIAIVGLKLKPGRHKFTITCVTHASCGIMEMLFGATSLGTHDLYTAGSVYNVQKVYYLNVGTTDTENLRIKCSGKNGASADYEIPISAIMYEQLMADEN